MSDEKKKTQGNENPEQQEINAEDLEQVTGGSIKDVNYTSTTNISADTQSKS